MSSTSLIMERGHIESGTVPVADAFSTTTGTSDVINMKDHNRVRFLVFWGVGATGTVKFTVEACDNVTPSNTSAIPFWYRITAAAGTPGTITRVSTAADGVTNTAGSNQIIEIEANVADMLASGYSYIRLKATEVVDSPILGGVLVELLEPRHAGASATSAVT
jgi:hypothetical protein